MDDIVQVKCYNNTKEYKRSEALKSFKECIEWSEGSEQERYINIYLQLLNGKTYCSDEE